MLVERERNRLGLKFKILLAIHDAILLEVPYEEVSQAKAVLRRCMTELVEVPGVGLHYGVDLDVYLRWNEKLADPAILAQLK